MANFSMTSSLYAFCKNISYRASVPLLSALTGLCWLGQSWFVLAGSVLVCAGWVSPGLCWLGQSWFVLAGSVSVDKTRVP